MTGRGCSDCTDDWPTPWPTPTYPQPAPVDESWRGLAQQIHQAVAAGSIPAEWTAGDLLRMLGYRDPWPGRRDYCRTITKLGTRCRNPCIPGLSACRFHVYANSAAIQQTTAV